ncbi:Dienelactone hydrolase family protein [Mycena kentingensis (nom. inval.)]|nr:Dienelactone hydrolase family protein [Mycena kentingensis (nom. inval.)]
MPSLDTRGIIAAVQIAAYSLIAVPCLYLTFRYALRRDAGWIFLLIFSLARIAGGALIVAGETVKNPTEDIFLAAYVLFHAGLAILMFATLGFLGLAGQHTYSEYIHTTRMVVAFFIIVALALGIAGCLLGTHVSPNQGHVGDILRKTSSVLYGAIYVFLIWVHIRCFDDRWEMRSHRRKLLYGTMLAFPFLGVRVAYEILSAFSASDLYGLSPSSNKTLAQFHPVTGKWIYYAIFGIAFEFVVAALYLLFSTVLGARRRRH